MKNLRFKRSLGLMAAVGLAVSAAPVMAQDTAAPAPAVSQPAPVALSPGVSQVLQLSQAKVGDSTVLAYIQNSGTGYTLTANQIIYLKQQGVSDAVLNAMLTKYQNGAPGTVATAPAPAAAPAIETAAPATTVVADSEPAPATTVYVPSTTYYYTPAYYGGYYYPYSYYGWGYPGVSLSFGYRGGWGGDRGGWGWGWGRHR